MPRKIRSLRTVRLDPFAALKRAFVRRGFIPRKPREPVNPKPVEAAEPTIPNTDVDHDSQPETGPAKLIDLTQKGQERLFKADTVFPFQLFPDTVILDREKLSVAARSFYRVAKITVVPIADMLNVAADVGPFFGSVHITSRYFSTKPLSVRFLWRGDAVRLQRLLQGYIIAHERKVDCTTIDTEHLVILLTDLGQGSSD
ncbi:MAG: hypothetical protein AAB541_03140 [Patescibacteria group bacterium]